MFTRVLEIYFPVIVFTFDYIRGFTKKNPQKNPQINP